MSFQLEAPDAARSCAVGFLSVCASAFHSLPRQRAQRSFMMLSSYFVPVFCCKFSQQISDVNNCHSLMVVIAGLPFFFPVTSRPVRNGEELLLSYGPHYWTVRIGLLSCSQYFIATSSVSRTLGCEALLVAF